MAADRGEARLAQDRPRLARDLVLRRLSVAAAVGCRLVDGEGARARIRRAPRFGRGHHAAVRALSRRKNHSGRRRDMTRYAAARALAWLAACSSFGSAAGAQDFPARPVRVVVGPGSDLLARLV